MPDDAPTLTLADWHLIKLAIGGYADSVNYHSQSATPVGRREMLRLVAELHRVSAKVCLLTGAPAAGHVLEQRAADTLAEADAVVFELA